MGRQALPEAGDKPSLDQQIQLGLKPGALARSPISAGMQMRYVTVNGRNQLRNTGALSGNGAKYGGNPYFGGFLLGSRHGHIRSVMSKYVLKRMSQLQRRLESPLGIFHTGPVGLVDHEDIGNLKNSRLDSLNVITQPRRFHDKGCLGQAGNIHFRLPSPHRFHQDDLKPGGVKNLYHASRCLGQPAKGTAGSHGTDKDTGISTEITHANAVAQDCSATEGAGGVHRNHADTPALDPAIMQCKLVNQ
jgi:hypothetical protein